MPYEIEFHPVGNGASSGDAITMRYWDGLAWRIIVIDGGYKETGTAIRDHVRETYGTDTIDDLVSSHPDDDHVGGLETLLTEMQVRRLWMHKPDWHAHEIIHLFKSGRWQAAGLQAAIQFAYPKIAYLVRLAEVRQTAVCGPFQGARIGPFLVLSPSRRLYSGLLPQFRDMPECEPSGLAAFGQLTPGVGHRTTLSGVNYSVKEDWWAETLRDGGTTSAENESSVVLYANLGDGGILLTADAGPVGLHEALSYASSINIGLKRTLRLLQVPHHGSRNNVGPQLLDRIVGPALSALQMLSPGYGHPACCVISAGAEDPTHPRKVVVNALLRRGLRPQATRGIILRVASGMGDRLGWGNAPSLPFANQVEAYD